MKRERWCGVERLSETVSGCVGAGDTWERPRPRASRPPGQIVNMCCYGQICQRLFTPLPKTSLVGLQLHLVNPLLKGLVMWPPPPLVELGVTAGQLYRCENIGRGCRNWPSVPSPREGLSNYTYRCTVASWNAINSWKYTLVSPVLCKYGINKLFVKRFVKNNCYIFRKCRL